MIGDWRHAQETCFMKNVVALDRRATPQAASWPAPNGSGMIATGKAAGNRIQTLVENDRHSAHLRARSQVRINLAVQFRLMVPAGLSETRLPPVQLCQRSPR
jgi:hypothetical protein